MAGSVAPVGGAGGWKSITSSRWAMAISSTTPTGSRLSVGAAISPQDQERELGVAGTADTAAGSLACASGRGIAKLIR